MRRNIVLLLGIAFCAVLLIGLQAQAQGVTIRRTSWCGEAQHQNELEVNEMFEKEHPDIKIVDVYLPDWPTYQDRILTMVAAGNSPDIAIIDGYYTQGFVKRGVVVNLQPYIERDNYDISDFFPYLLREAMYKEGAPFQTGDIYGFPCYCSTLSTIINMDMFKEAGIPLPDTKKWTQDDFVEIAQKLTKDSSGDGKVDQWGTNLEKGMWWPLVYSNGGSLLNKERTKCTLDQPEAYEALQWMADWYLEYGVTPSPAPQLMDLFMTDKVGMLYAQWTASLSAYKSQGVPFDWTIGYLPAGKAGAISVSKGNSYVVSTQSEHPDEAWEVMKFLQSPQVQEFLGQKLQQIPTRMSVAQSREYYIRDYTPYDLSPFVFGNAVNLPLVPQYREIQETWRSALEDLWMGEATAKEVCSAIAAKVNKLLSE